MLKVLRNSYYNPAIYIVFSSLFTLIFLSSCTPHAPNRETRKVFIKNKKENFSLIRNNTPFIIKGAGGFTQLNALHQAGGNTIRVWDTVNLDVVLKEAAENKLAVIVGLPMPDSKFMDFYNDSSKVKQQLARFKTTIQKYKNDPSVLMWCVGNELNFPYKFLYKNFYKAFNNIVAMIHTEDPNHPVTTTVLDFNKKYIFNLQLKCNIDVISFNIFNRLPLLKDDLYNFSWCWSGPYIITEWGIDGPWLGTAETAWGAFIENSTTKKAEMYKERYEKYMPANDPRFLGSFVFYWGQKQETTHTWFSMFDENGAKAEAVSTVQYLWTGKPPAANKPPQINYMLIDKVGVKDNLIYKPGITANAEVVLLQNDSNITSIKWEIFPEDWYKNQDGSTNKKPKALGGLTFNTKDLETHFITPSAEGPYRLFATLYDKYGNFASCNIPFYVASSK